MAEAERWLDVHCTSTVKILEPQLSWGNNGESEHEKKEGNEKLRPRNDRWKAPLT